MRIVQLIDSLDAGGAERMAVSYANELVSFIEFSGLIATRKEGDLISKISNKVNYTYLNKKHSLDLKAIFYLFKYVKKYKITHVHAHSSSFFIAVLIKLICWNIQIVWHDHYGKSEFLNERKYLVLKIASFFFSKIIVVNDLLLIWNKEKLYCKDVHYLSNFPVLDDTPLVTKLEGEFGKRILLLANLRPQKDLEFLIQIVKQLNVKYPDWTFHVVGKKFNDEYQNKIEKLVISENLEKSIFFYDSCIDIKNLLNQVQIGILTSKSEGLPVSVLEYGLVGLPVVVTNVGQISKVIKNNENGFLINSGDIENFTNSLLFLIENKELRIIFGRKLNEKIELNYSSSFIIKQYLDILN